MSGDAQNNLEDSPVFNDSFYELGSLLEEHFQRERIWLSQHIEEQQQNMRQNLRQEFAQMVEEQRMGVRQLVEEEVVKLADPLLETTRNERLDDILPLRRSLNELASKVDNLALEGLHKKVHDEVARLHEQVNTSMLVDYPAESEKKMSSAANDTDLKTQIGSVCGSINEFRNDATLRLAGIHKETSTLHERMNSTEQSMAILRKQLVACGMLPANSPEQIMPQMVTKAGGMLPSDATVQVVSAGNAVQRRPSANYVWRRPSGHYVHRQPSTSKASRQTSVASVKPSLQRGYVFADSPGDRIQASHTALTSIPSQQTTLTSIPSQHALPTARSCYMNVQSCAAPRDRSPEPKFAFAFPEAIPSPRSRSQSPNGLAGPPPINGPSSLSVPSVLCDGVRSKSMQLPSYQMSVGSVSSSSLRAPLMSVGSVSAASAPRLHSGQTPRMETPRMDTPRMTSVDAPRIPSRVQDTSVLFARAAHVPPATPAMSGRRGRPTSGDAITAS